MLNGLTTDYIDFGTVSVVDLDFIMGKSEFGEVNKDHRNVTKNK